MIMFNRTLTVDARRAVAALMTAILLGTIPMRCGYSAETPRLPEDVTQALARNASQLDPLSITWTRIRRTPLSLRHFLTKINYIYSWDFMQPYNVTFKWQAGCAYLRNSSKRILAGTPKSKEPPLGWDTSLKLETGVGEHAFDGTYYYNGNGGLPNAFHTPGLGIEPVGRVESQPCWLCYPDFLEFAGFAFPYSASESKRPASSSILYLLGQKASLVRTENRSFDGHQALVVDLLAKERWLNDQTLTISWRLSADYNYAVLGYEERTPDGRLLRSIRNSDFVQVPGRDVYLPRRSVVRYYTWRTVPTVISSQALLEEMYIVSELDCLPIAKGQFSLRESYRNPGTNITDYTIPSNKEDYTHYVIPANLEDLDRVIEAAQTGKAYVPLPQRSRLGLMLAIAGLVVTASAFVIRRLRRRVDAAE